MNSKDYIQSQKRRISYSW